MKRRRDGSALSLPADGPPQSAEDRVQALRTLMKGHELDAFVVHSEDPHMSEYVAACHERRAFLSGFTGSAGTAVVTNDEALVWTDGRYFVQAKNELDADGGVFKLMKIHQDPTVEEWLAKNVKESGRIGYDPSVVSLKWEKKLKESLEESKRGIVSAPLDPGTPNPVDVVWGENKPPQPRSKVVILEMKYAGETGKSKIERMRGAMRKANATHLVVAALDEVAWLLNLRGSDVDYNPVFWAYVLISLDSATLYVDSSRFAEGVDSYVKDMGVKILSYDAFLKDLGSLSEGANIWIDPSSCNSAIVMQLKSCVKGVTLMEKLSPVSLAKAKKNDTELGGMKAAHVRDGVAVVKFLAWLEKEVTVNNKQPSECEAADKLDSLRAEQEHFVSLSFPTISGSGSNGAIIHYRPEQATCAKITADQVYLVDSGGQYKDGTTDVTRTVHFGTPTKWEIECFTRVLRGHIAIDTAMFPSGTMGHSLDSFARAPLWEAGLNYKHGTGHGVGCFLNVHEGPHMISSRVAAQGTPFEPGFLVSNEPGYYEEGAFGVRIENVCAVVEAKPREKSDSQFYTFEHLTLVPLQKKMINFELLSPKEAEWVTHYNQECYSKLSPFLRDDPEALKWLERNAAS